MCQTARPHGGGRADARRRQGLFHPARLLAEPAGSRQLAPAPVDDRDNKRHRRQQPAAASRDQAIAPGSEHADPGFGERRLAAGRWWAK